MMARTQRESVRKAISHYFFRYRLVKAELKGRDLQALGIPPGPVYKQLLDELLQAQLNGIVKNRQEELSYLQDHHSDLFHSTPNDISRVSV